MFFLKSLGIRTAKRINTFLTGNSACRQFVKSNSTLSARGLRPQHAFRADGTMFMSQAKNWRVSSSGGAQRFFTTGESGDGEEQVEDVEVVEADLLLMLFVVEMALHQLL